MAVGQEGSPYIHQGHPLLPGQGFHRPGIPLLMGVDVADISQPRPYRCLVQVPAPPVKKPLGQQRRQVHQNRPDPRLPQAADHPPVPLPELRQRHRRQMGPGGIRRDVPPAEVAVVAPEVHHHRLAGPTGGQQPVQQLCSLDAGGPEVGIVAHMQVKLRLQLRDPDVVADLIATRLWIYLDPLQDRIPQKCDLCSALHKRTSKPCNLVFDTILRDLEFLVNQNFGSSTPSGAVSVSRPAPGREWTCSAGHRARKSSTPAMLGNP